MEMKSEERRVEDESAKVVRRHHIVSTLDVGFWVEKKKARKTTSTAATTWRRF